MPTRIPSPSAPESLSLPLHVTSAVALQPLLAEHQGRCYPSAVRGYTEGETIVVDLPTRDGVPIPLPDGAAITLHLTAPDGVRSCPTRILRHRVGPEPALELAWPDQVVRLNRRETVRITTAIVVDVSYTGADGRGPRLVRCTTADLSEEGMRLMTAEPIEAGTELSLRLNLPNCIENFLCGGRVVRSGVSRFPGHAERPWISVAFVNVAPAMQRSLRKYLWSVQRESLRKGVRS
jgi:c-di-GMP-binding flagellar brake protein YcgR